MRPLLLLALTAVSAQATPTLVAPHLDVRAAEEILRLEALPSTGVDREQAEKRYAKLVQTQIYSDLLTLYAPENAKKLQITYASFTPESEPEGGDDRGFGLHVVKRLVIEENGHSRTIEVNEGWPEDRPSGGLLPPDEIRVKALAFLGPRRVPESHRLYLFHSLHLAWGPGNMEAAIFQRSRYAGLDERGRNRLHGMRVPVSSPYSCLGCHGPRNQFSAHFTQPGEARNFEAIVQDSQFRLPIEQSPGYRQYMSYLTGTRKVTPRFRDEIGASLRDARAATRIPHLRETLMKFMDSESWLYEDGGYSDYELAKWSRAEALRRQGVYLGPQGEVLRDALEEASEGAFEGKYRFWFPTPLIPLGYPAY